MSQTLETRIARLEAESAIQSLITDLGRAFDSGPSAEALRDLFLEDARFVVDQYDTFEGAESIAMGVAGNAESGFLCTLHYLLSPRVVLGADSREADVEFYLWEIATAASGRAYWIGGRYEAQAVADGDRWRFARLELKADIISHYPQGWNAKPANLADA